MSWNLDDKEQAAVLQLPAAQRYDYFVKRVVDFEELWSLRANEGWVLAADDFGHLTPVWPHAAYARICARGPWNEAAPTAIALDTWLEAWIPGMVRDERGVAVFPTPADKGIAREPEQVRQDLEAEMLKYE